MLTLPPTVREFLALEPIDMRHSFDGLAALVQARLGQDPLSGHLYAFVNSRRTLLKLLFFDRTGYCIVYRRLERGTFQLPKVPAGQSRAELAPVELALILEGIDLSTAARRKRYLRRPSGVLES
jgi:transposase